MDEELKTPNFDRYKELERKYAQEAQQKVEAAVQQVQQENAELRRQLAAYQTAQPSTKTTARPMI